MKVITVNVPQPYIDYIEQLEQKGYIDSRSDFIRKAIEHYIHDFDYTRAKIDHPIPEAPPKITIQKAVGTTKPPKYLARGKSKLGNIHHPELIYLHNGQILEAEHQ